MQASKTSWPIASKQRLLLSVLGMILVWAGAWLSLNYINLASPNSNDEFAVPSYIKEHVASLSRQHGLNDELRLFGSKQARGALGGCQGESAGSGCLIRIGSDLVAQPWSDDSQAVLAIVSHEFGHVLQSRQDQMPGDNIFTHLTLLVPIFVLLVAALNLVTVGVLTALMLGVTVISVKVLGYHSFDEIVRGLLALYPFFGLSMCLFFEPWKTKSLWRVAGKGCAVFFLAVIAWLIIRMPAGWPARQSELAADVTGACAVNARAMESALNLLGRDSIPIDDYYDAEHPPIRVRISRIRALAQSSAMPLVCAAIKKQRPISEILNFAN